jgi:hypothetical protein
LGLDSDEEKKAVKYSAKPWADNKFETKSQETLGESLERQLQNHDVYFDFCVQVQTDSEKMPVEDPTIEWSEKESEFVKVATIRIPRQTFTSKEQQEFGENLSFTPWHSLPEHTPLGGINRVRKAVYLATAKARRQENKVSTEESTPDTFKPSLLEP